MLLSGLTLLRPPTSRLGASMVATATAEPLAPQRFGPDRPLDLGGCACEVATGSAGGELRRLRGLFDEATLDALLAAARSSMHFETDPDTVDGSATYHASIIEAGEPVDATLAALQHGRSAEKLPGSAESSARAWLLEAPRASAQATACPATAPGAPASRLQGRSFLCL